jgi:hypothetical protein
MLPSKMKESTDKIFMVAYLPGKAKSLPEIFDRF